MENELRQSSTDDRISTRTLCKFLAGKVDPSIEARIAREMDIIGSPVQKWFADLDAKPDNPLENIDWLELAAIPEATSDDDHNEGKKERASGHLPNVSGRR
jgi:hypothetical protein